MYQYLENLEKQKEKKFLYPLYRGVRTVVWKNLQSTVFDDKFITPCVAGKKLIVISETGVVRPCEILDKDKDIGNLRDYNFDLKKLMKSKKQKDVHNWIVDTKCKCSFECALAANVVWNASQYGKVLKASTKNF